MIVLIACTVAAVLVVQKIVSILFPTKPKTKELKQDPEHTVKIIRHSKHDVEEQKENFVRCSCGFIADTIHIYHLHVEHHGNSLKPVDETGWPAKQFETVPVVDKCQKALVAKGDLNYGVFSTITLNLDALNDAHFLETCSSFANLIDSVASIDKEARLVAMIGFSDKLWRRYDANPPKQLIPFSTIKSKNNKEVFPATAGGELFIMAKCLRQDLCYELVKKFVQKLGTANISSVDHQPTFRYMGVPMGARDLTGFMDGTRNPDHLLRAIADEALIFPLDDDAAHTGGSYLYAGRYVHDLKTFEQLCPAARNQIIGRDYDIVKPHKGYDTRPENPRLKDAEEASHSSRAHGSMYRHAMPFVSGKEEGLYFVCCSRSMSEIDTALKRMAGHFAQDGSLDNLFKITRAVTNFYYYVPSKEELSNLKTKKLLTNPTVAATTITKAASNKKKLDIYIESCTNCGYFSIYKEKKRYLEEALKGTSAENEYDIEIHLNPMMPRLSAFEITIPKDDHVLWSKLSQQDGKNNYPHVFPKNSTLVINLRKYLNLPYDDVKVKDHDSDIGGRVGVW